MCRNKTYSKVEVQLFKRFPKKGNDFVGSIISGIFIHINILICYGISVDVCFLPSKITLRVITEIQQVVLGIFSGN